MSVSVKSLLKLPSLANAKVIAGRNGLDRIVAAVSVLETVEYNLIERLAYNNDEYNGSEIVITGFLNAADDFTVQYESVRRLAMSGEAGLIIYYVGAYVKSIDKRIIKLADELNFPIICMPENNTNLRYSEAISDIMGLVIRDQLSGESLVINLLESISKLPKHQQSVGTMLKLLSGRIKSCVILTNDRQRVLYEAAWPSELEGIHKHIAKMKPSDFKSNPMVLTDLNKELVYLEPIHASGVRYNMYIVSAGGAISDVLIQQSSEAVRVALKLWDKDTAENSMSEIVSAILRDEPIKMRSLASMFNIEIAAANSMWIVSGNELNESMLEKTITAAKQFCATVVADIYKSEIVIFANSIKDKQDVDLLKDDIRSIAGQDSMISYFAKIPTTSGVRRTYTEYSEYKADMVRILPQKDIYLSGDLEFAKTCRNVVENGDGVIGDYMEVIKGIEPKGGSDSLVETLCAFLLDYDCNVQLTADKLFVHKNTIKYRIKIIGDNLGFAPGKMPDSTKLYISCGIARLMG